MRWTRYAAATLLVAVVYVALAQLAWSAGSMPGKVSPVWLPAGFAVALVVRRGPSVLLGVFVGELVANSMAGQAWPIAAAMGVGNVLEAATAWWLLGRDRDQVVGLHRARHVGRWALAAVLAAPVSAAVGVGSLIAGGIVPAGAWEHTAVVWAAGDLLGILILGSALLAWTDRRHPRLPVLESVAALTSLSAACLLVFAQQDGLPYLAFPFVAWLALRATLRGATAAICLTTVIAVLSTVQGRGPFTRHGDVSDRLWLLDVFLAILAITGLLLAATVSERNSAQSRLHEANSELEQRVAERTAALTWEQARLDEAQQAALIGSWEWDIHADRVSWSRQLYRLFEVEPDAFDATYDNYLSLIHPEDRPLLRARVELCLISHEPYQVDHRLNLPHEGAPRWVRSRGHVTLDEAGMPVRLSGTAQDVTETVTLQAELARQARYDNLTGLPNRYHLAERLAERAWGHPDPSVWRREVDAAPAGAPVDQHPVDVAGAEPFAVLFVDLDGFKPVNDRHGHAVGDQVLAAVARRLGDAVRHGGTVARLGGDEFAVVLPGVAHPDAVRAVATRLIAATARPVSAGGLEVLVSASIGAAIADPHELFDHVLHRADTAMYEAKRGGGNQVAFAAPAGRDRLPGSGEAVAGRVAAG